KRLEVGRPPRHDRLDRKAGETCEALVEVRRVEVEDDYAPWHFLYFLPDPHQQGSLRPILSRSLVTRCCVATAPPPPSIRATAPPGAPPPAAAIASPPASDSCSCAK